MRDRSYDKAVKFPASIRPLVLTAILILLLSGTSRVVGAAASDSSGLRTKLQAATVTANQLYREISELVAATPSTGRGADIIAGVNGPGHRFGVEERRFQDAIKAIQVSPPDVAPDLFDTLDRLGQFDNFAFSAYQSVVLCKPRAARFNLRIAKDLLDEVHRAMAGHPRPDWDPPTLDDDVPSDGSCSGAP